MHHRKERALNYIKVGDDVLVTLPHQSEYLEIRVDNLRQFDGKMMKVKKKVKYKTNTQAYYELEGAVSEGYGIPYSFLHEWLIKL